MAPRKRKTNAVNLYADKAPTAETVKVTVLIAFNGMYAGDTADTELTPAVQGWIDAGLVRVDGADQVGPGRTVADDPRGVAAGARGGGAAGDEPSEGFGAGSYGAFAGVDPSGVQTNGDAAV